MTADIHWEARNATSRIGHTYAVPVSYRSATVEGRSARRRYLVFQGHGALCALSLVLLVLMCASSSVAQTSPPVLPLEPQPKRSLENNLQRQDGAPSPNVIPQPSPNQFGSLMSYGGVAEAESPSAKRGDGTVIILQRAHVGAPYLNRSVSFSFGAVIPPPSVNFNGDLLAVDPTTYWDAKPYNGPQGGSGYYYSPHAKQVFAVQSGPIHVTWRKKIPFTETNKPDYINKEGKENDSFEKDGPNHYLLYTVSYIVSGSPAKTPRKMYWTEKSYRRLGKPVHVPAARVGAVNIVYNTTFRKTVDEEYKSIGDSRPGEGTKHKPLPELRTLWYDQQLEHIYAYNQEGRVFVEFLGDLKTDNRTREHLGYEIVDVSRRATPSDRDTELGERILPPAPGTVETLFPEPVLQGPGASFDYQHHRAGREEMELYAARRTVNPNDYIVYWMEKGVENVKWPRHLTRYQLIWPRDVGKYSHYLRAAAATDSEAAQTAVALTPGDVPNISYQDPLDRPRAKLTAESKFYTWLDDDQPVHRTLLQYSSGEEVAFERVFSWLDTKLHELRKEHPDDYVQHLSALRQATPKDPAAATATPVDELTAPRVVNQHVEVGQRIGAPERELGAGSGQEYWAGYINKRVGTLFDVNAYVDPFTSGFEEANQKAIIPVNAIPRKNELEVWWFRSNTSRAGTNAGDVSKGFATNYWPSVIGRYTIGWPAEPREIVLASQLGGQNLSSLEAKGTIYFQNDPDLDGYNPNEEHAIMSGGTPYATRDDLNITDDSGYSSGPYVLVAYEDADGRPAITPFKVLREKPEAGYVFDYIVTAGRKLPPPPPLTFLPKPVQGSGDRAVNYNTEPIKENGDASDDYDHYRRFTYRDRKHDFWVYRGPHSGPPKLEAGTYDADKHKFLPPGPAVAVVGKPFRFTLHASRQDQNLELTIEKGPNGLSVDHLSLVGTPQKVGSHTVGVMVKDRFDNASVTGTLKIEVEEDSAEVATQSSLSIATTHPYTGTTVEFKDRPPFLAERPRPANSFTMRYYYKTEAGFAWPGVTHPPATGSIVPYLRRKGDDGQFIGKADSKKDAIDIVYRPVWPVADPSDSAKPLPTLQFGKTLTGPADGLPGIRDWKTAQILYQQSIAADLAEANDTPAEANDTPAEANSAVLYDPTVFKISDLDTHEMDKLPAGVKTENLRGNTYFSNLPPHLGRRLYLDPNRGLKGSLILKGEFRKETLGDSYLLLNVLGGEDLKAALALCPKDDDDRKNWENAINALEVDVQTYHEDPAKPGTYIPKSTETVKVKDVVKVKNDNIPRDSYALSATGPGSGYITLLENSGTAFTEPGDPVAMHIIKVGGPKLYRGELKIIPAENPLSELVTLQHTADLAGNTEYFEYEWKIAAPVDGGPPESDLDMSGYQDLESSPDNSRHTLGGAGLQTLGDNYVVMRYRPTHKDHPLFDDDDDDDKKWSEWTDPALSEGWIKRVLAGINPFNQRISDLFNNRVNTDASILTAAGPRWEGDIAMNRETINNYGLIEIYETVLRRGRSLSIEAGYNYGPANDALLLAAGYLNDLYMMLGNEAWADAANPTIGIGTADKTYGDISTALFSFKGQQASLLEEELALLRGRDDVFQPGVEIRPIYNRLIWNYTRGIDAGEVVYALNYNIQENPNVKPDGIINAEDAAHMFPQGHGDAYGHYLTALKGYYSLLLNSKFDWVPRIEAVNVLGKPVSVDYQDERKFAAAAAAVARTGRQVFDLTWRKDYQSLHQDGWDHFADSRENPRREYASPKSDQTHPVRHWGMDQWATRVGQGTYLNWVVGNSMLPAVDPDENHEGIQKVDRTTVPELRELPTLAGGLQTAMENAEAGLSPLGVPEGAIALDIGTHVTGDKSETHFEQIYRRALAALNNAVIAFDDAKNVTRLMRSEQDSLADLQSQVAQQELAYQNLLIELYGTPYPDDMKPGKTWSQDYQGPDTIHYMYVGNPELDFQEMWNHPGKIRKTTWSISLADLPKDWGDRADHKFLEVFNNPRYTDQDRVIHFAVSPHGYFGKPADWKSRRASPGRIQEAISAEITALNRLHQAVFTQSATKSSLDRLIKLFRARIETQKDIDRLKGDLLIAEEVLEKAKFANDLYQKVQSSIREDILFASDFSSEALPGSLIVGISSGGDLTSAGRSAIQMAGYTTTKVMDKLKLVREGVVSALETSTSSADRWVEFGKIRPLERARDQRAALVEIGKHFEDMQDHLWGINLRLREYDGSKRKVRSLLAEGNRIQEEREVFRKHSSAQIQGFRTRDAAFRIFRNEKLERYKAMFDLSARYALLAANAYDYETGLLDTSEDRDFVRRIIQSRSLGVVGSNGEPHFAGSDTGDPGLSSALAEMKADWEVVRSRLGFNNPDSHGTTVSLRTEGFRDDCWTQILHDAKKDNLLEDADVARYCMQITNSDRSPVPGIILTFKTEIADGKNLFGQDLAGCDHTYSATAFATKIFSVGVALEGYQGMDDSRGKSEVDPHPLSATPYIYLIPVGVDSMRSPPLGDASRIRSWMVNDVAIPMPLNIGKSKYSTTHRYHSNDSLSEPLFSARKHPAFRPVSDAALFSTDIYSHSGSLLRSPYTSNRLVGRSVWNSEWKLIIPGKTLLKDPDEGLNRLIKTLKDVKLHFVTYSYSGN